MNEIKITLPTDYTVGQAFEDAGLAVFGFSHTVRTQTDPLDGSPVVNINHEGDWWDVVVQYTPEELREMGKQVWLGVINERINTTRLAALKLRLESAHSAIIGEYHVEQPESI